MRLEEQVLVLQADVDVLGVLELAAQQPFAQRVLDEPLDRALEGTGAGSPG